MSEDFSTGGALAGCDNFYYIIPAPYWLLAVTSLVSTLVSITFNLIELAFHHVGCCRSTDDRRLRRFSTLRFGLPWPFSEVLNFVRVLVLQFQS